MEQPPIVENEQIEDEMEYEIVEPTNIDKWRYTLYTTIFALILFNKYIYKFMDSLVGKYVKIASANGNPTLTGFFIHLLVFTLILRFSMDFDI